MKRFFKEKFNIRITSLLLVLVLMLELLAATVTAISYYTVKINYHYIDGSPAHDPYIATFTVEEAQSLQDYDVTNPNVNGFEPMALSDPNNDPAALPTGGVSAATTHVVATSLTSLDHDLTYDVYYVAGLTHYAARYYLQNIYDDLYTLDRDRTNANQNRLGYTGTAPADLEAEVIPGFTSLFHEPDAIAADGSTVFRVYFDRNYYSINFDLGEGGYGVEPVYAKYGSVYRIEEPTRMGYTFLGWARTSADSSKGEEGEDWSYIKPDAVPDIDSEGHYHYAAEDCYADENEARQNLVQLQDMTDLTVPFYNSHYKAIWEPGTTSLSVMYWVENADNDGYSVIASKDIYNAKIDENAQLTKITAGMEITSSAVIRNLAQKAKDEKLEGYDGRDAKYVGITDLFGFNLGYADPEDSRNVDTEANLTAETVYKYDKNGSIIDFVDISKGTSEELAGCGDFFELNTAENTSDPRYVTDTSVTVRGDGTSHFNVFFKRKTFTLKFYYARQGYTNGELDPNKISLTNSTKQFNNNSTEKEYLKTTSKNVLEAIAMGSWEPNSAETLPTVKDEYKQRVTEGYDDFTDARYGGYYRYYYYQLQAKYNEPLKDKWLIDALDTVHRKGSGEAEICYPGSIATEYYNKYYQDRKSSGNYTVKGIYEKLDKGILFTDSARTTMKQNNIDYTKLHFLISWTNTSYNNGWNSSITRVLHFRYENYVELLPREIEIIEHSGQQALIDEGNYTDVRQFTTKVKENGNMVSKTKWYGLSTDHVYETIDSGNQYDPGKNKTQEARKNQTPTQMTGFEIENLRTVNGLITLDDDNTIVDWSEDTTNYRRCTIKFFYRRRVYTLRYSNCNRMDESHTRTVMYGAPINSQYSYTEDGHDVNEYRYYWPDPQYFDENRRDFFTFDGWYNDPRYEEPFDLDTQTMPADDDTLFAKWVPKSIDVIFYNDYDDYYIDRKGAHPEKRVVLGKDDDDNDIRDINVDYGSYVPLSYIPINNDEPDNPRPRLTPIAEGASFAGWYYIRNRVPVRFEPENVPITALNEEATGDNAKLRLFAEWVTKDVAKYKVSYVKDSDDTEIAAPTTGRAYVSKTKTFNAKSGSELYDEYKWDAEKEDEGTNWWPTTNSSSMVIKANNSDDEYAPNTIEFRYIQKSRVWYKVQYLDASSRRPLYDDEDEYEGIIKNTAHASVKEDARIIPGHVVRDASQSLVLTASSNPDPDAAKAEELATNVITFLYDENKNEYMYEVEYLTQDLGANTYSLYSAETLTEPIVTQGVAVNLPIANLFSGSIPSYLAESGYTRVNGGCTYTVTASDGTVDNTEIPVADNGTVSISGTDKKTIKIYFNRNNYNYKYQYIDHTAEKAYLNYLEAHKDDPDPTAGAPWDGVLYTSAESSGQVGQEITINPETDITGTDLEDGETYKYTRITNSEGELNPVTLTIQSNEDWNVAKVYYRKDIERELQYKMVCVNDNSETDYYEDGTPKFGRLNRSMQTVLDYEDIQNIVFHDTNNEMVDEERNEYLHLHRYTFLGWYSTPEYNENNPSEGRLTTSTTLTKELLGTSGELPDNNTKYYALVKQDMVKMDVMFYYTDDYTVDEFRAENNDEDLGNDIQDAVDNFNNDASVPDSQKVHPTGEHVGKQVTFTAPNGYINHEEVPWHRNDGYTLQMDDLDERVYKYKFAEWWEIDERNNNALIRHDNWNSADGWDPDQLSQQLSRNRNQYLIAVYARRDDINELPYNIDYKYTDRKGVERTYVMKGTLSGKYLDESDSDCRITSDGDYRLKKEFILANAPYESNYGQTLCWTDTNTVASSIKGDPSSEKPAERNDRLVNTVTAKQVIKKVVAHYRLDPDGAYADIVTDIGANRNDDENLAVIDARGRTYGDKAFSYWEIRKKADSDVIAKCYDPWFTFCMMDSYYITPVYNGEVDIETEDTGEFNGTTSVQLRHLDDSRNHWTDDEVDPTSGDADLLYSDFEISFNNKDKEIYNSEDYKTGVVFELCTTIPESATFDPTRNYNQVTNYTNLAAAIKSNAKTYQYKSGKNRNIMISEIPTEKLTNKNRVEFAMPFKNAYKVTTDPETGEEISRTYTNSRYLMKVTAFLRGKGENGVFDSDDNIICSENPVYICLKAESLKELVRVNDLLYTD